MKLVITNSSEINDDGLLPQSLNDHRPEGGSRGRHLIELRAELSGVDLTRLAY